jgi:hypothetical protein
MMIFCQILSSVTDIDEVEERAIMLVCWTRILFPFHTELFLYKLYFFIVLFGLSRAIQYFLNGFIFSFSRLDIMFFAKSFRVACESFVRTSWSKIGIVSNSELLTIVPVWVLFVTEVEVEEEGGR